MSNDKILEAAKIYHQVGWSMFPWNGRKREPLVQWSTIKAQPSSEEMERWFKNTNNGIAIITGRLSGIVAIDVDVDPDLPDEHFMSRARSEERFSKMPDTGCIALTPRGGRHYLYRYPSEIPHVDNAVNLFGAGIDIRADGGSITVEPSKHYYLDGHYKWFKFLHDQLSELPDWAQVPFVAPSWVAGLGAFATKKENSNKWLTDLWDQGAQKGERNDSLAKLAGYFAGNGIVQDFAVKLCEEWNDRSDQPLGEREVRTTVASIYKTHGRRSVSQESVANSAHKIEPAANDSTLPTPLKKLNVLSLGDMIMQHDKEMLMDIEGWWPRAVIGFLISKPQCFKSWMSLDMIVSIATGRPFLGKYKVNRTGSVLLFQQEDSFADMLNRLALILFSKHENMEITYDNNGIVIPVVDQIEEIANRIICHDQRSLRLDDPVAMEELEVLVDKYRPVMVVVDPFYLTVPLDNFMVEAAQHLLAVRRLRDKYGTSFVFVHHNNKAADSWSRDGMWGSQLLAAAMETCWTIRRNPSTNASIIKRHFKGSGEQNLVQVSFDINSERIPWRYNVDCEEVSEKLADKLLKSGPELEDVEDEIIAALSRKKMSIADLSHELCMGKESILDNLYSLKKKKKVRKTADDIWIAEGLHQ